MAASDNIYIRKLIYFTIIDENFSHSSIIDEGLKLSSISLFFFFFFFFFNCECLAPYLILGMLMRLRLAVSSNNR
jgi:hypothetical protein